MPALTVRARSLPYRPPPSVTARVCDRCGIGFRNHKPNRDGYHTECRDCRDVAKGLPEPKPAPKPKPAPAPRKTYTARKRNPPSPCGTDSAYGRHRKKGEPIDPACRKAHSEAGKRRYQARKART